MRRLEEDRIPREEFSGVALLMIARHTFDVPKIFGSSLFFKEPAPTDGKLDDKTTILPPIADWGNVSLQ